MATHHAEFERADRYKEGGNRMDWEGEFVPQWQSGKALSRMFVIGAARRRLAKARRAGSQNFAMLECERQAYYAPCDCELREAFWHMPQAQQQKELERARRARWAVRTAAGKRIGDKPTINFGAWYLRRSQESGRWEFV